MLHSTDHDGGTKKALREARSPKGTLTAEDAHAQMERMMGSPLRKIGKAQDNRVDECIPDGGGGAVAGESDGAEG